MAGRRTRGDGSIRKRSDGRWEGRYTAGRNEETGKLIYKSVLARTQAECKRRLREAMRQQEQQVDEHEGCTAILAGDVRKAPDVAQTDGASGRNQDEAQSGTKLFSFFHCLLPLLRKSHRVALF